jgi:hypothetical protein
MTVDELRRLLIAPEIIVLDVALAALRALLLEHPLLKAPPSADDPLVWQRARSVLRRAARLGYDATCASAAASSKPFCGEVNTACGPGVPRAVRTSSAASARQQPVSAHLHFVTRLRRQSLRASATHEWTAKPLGKSYRQYD